MQDNFLITGGEGFIGRNLKQHLIEQGNSVKTLDIVGNPDYKISVTSWEELIKLKEDFDGIFHLAATTSPPQFEENPQAGFYVNVNGTLNILEFAKLNSVPRVVLASSSSTYGDQLSISSESSLPDSYANLYPITKVLGEHLGRYYSLRNEVQCVSLRYFNTYGPDENSKGLYSSPISKFINFARRGEPIVIYGDGKQKRDFIYVKDNVVATYLAFKNGKPGESYNVGTGISTDFNSIALLIKKILDSNSKIVHVANPLKSYQMFTQADMNKTRSDLGFGPRYDLSSAIREMIRN